MRCRPDLLSGTPIDRDNRAFAAEIPTARRQLNDRPYRRLIERGRRIDFVFGSQATVAQQPFSPADPRVLTARA